ncbi:hypothetical protein BH10BAC3_BH10BAC3_21460 [soil metagenome]
MKNTVTTFLKLTVILPAVLLACMVATAQRGDRNGNGAGQQGRGAGNGQQQSRNSDMGRSSVGQQRSGSYQQRDISGQTDRSFGNHNPRNGGIHGDEHTPFISPRQNPSRSFSNTPDDRNSNARPAAVTTSRPDPRDRFDNTSNYNRPDNVNPQRNSTANNRGYNNYGSSIRNGYYGSNRGNYYSSQNRHHYDAPCRYTYNYPYYGQRYSRLNFNFNVISYGGIGYCYNSGIFYRPFSGYYQVVAPPPGICINLLPFGYSRVYYDDVPYYFYGNTYYREYNNSYRVVDPPIGAKLPALPRTAKEVVIDDEHYYEDNSTYYMEEFNEKNERLYTVVGVNGVLDSDQVNRVINGTSFSNVAPQTGGNIYSSLPANSTKVTISGHEYFRSPDDVYYQAITEGTSVTYHVVGK